MKRINFVAGLRNNPVHSYDGQPSQRVFFFRVKQGLMPNREKGFFLFYYLPDTPPARLARRSEGSKPQKNKLNTA